MIERMVGGTRDGENGAWKYLRLHPLAILIVSFIVGYTALQGHVSVLADSLKETRADTKTHEDKFRNLEQQSVRVEEQLKRLNEKVEEQRSALQDITRDLRRTIDLLQPTPGRK